MDAKQELNTPADQIIIRQAILALAAYALNDDMHPAFMQERQRGRDRAYALSAVNALLEYRFRDAVAAILNWDQDFGRD